jgi:hypothetical protein
MPHWNLRTNAQTISADLLLPVQDSVLDSAIRHIGFQKEESLQSLLQVSTGSVLQTPQEVLLLCLCAGVLVALVVGGIAFWFTFYESGKSLHAKFPEDHMTSHKHHSAVKEPEPHQRDVQKTISTAASLFPSNMVGSQIRVEGVLTTEPEDLIIEVFDATGGLITRALVCEKGSDPGILIEDAFSVPLAFIDTSAVVKKMEMSPTLHIHKLGDDAGIFGIIRHEDKNGRLVVRSAHGRLLMALQGDYHGRSLNVVNDSSRLVGSVQRNQGTSKVMIHPGADAGVLICGLFGMGKIGKLGPS